MSENEAAEIIIDYLKGLFPKSCPNCHRHFASLKEFYLNTNPAGAPYSKDLDADEALPPEPKGSVAISYCTCGYPIALTSQGMPVFRYWEVVIWARLEMSRRKISATDLLSQLRVVVRNKVIQEPESR